MPFLLAFLMLFVSSLIFSACTSALSPFSVKSLLCSCNGIGFSMFASIFACFLSYLALVFLLIVLKSTPPSSLDFGAFGSGTRVHNQAGYSLSSSATKGFGGCLKYDNGVNGVPPATELLNFIGAETDGLEGDAGGDFTPAVDGKNGSEKGCDAPATPAEACSGVFDDAVDGDGTVGAAFLVAGAVATLRIHVRDGFITFWFDNRVRSVRRQLLHSIVLWLNFRTD